MSLYQSLWLSEKAFKPTKSLRMALLHDSWSDEDALWLLMGIDPKSIVYGYELDFSGYPDQSSYWLRSLFTLDGQRISRDSLNNPQFLHGLSYK